MTQNLHLHIHVHMHRQPASAPASAPAAADGPLLGQAAAQQLQAAAPRKSASTVSNYQTALRSFQRYAGADMRLHALQPAHISGYERWLRQQGVCQNTVSCYMRSLRSLLRQAGCDTATLFGHVFTGHVSTEKRSVPATEVCRLQALQLPRGSFAELARDVFLFSFYAMGMPFVDVAHLRRSQVADGRIVYHRQKTGQRVSMAVEPPMLDIISRHTPQATADFVFPLLRQGTDREYAVLLARYNRALARLARQAQLGHKLTSYVVRHTWASMAYHANVDLSVISRALGHTNPHTTLTYIREIDDNRLFTANRSIISLVAPAQ